MRRLRPLRPNNEGRCPERVEASDAVRKNGLRSRTGSLPNDDWRWRCQTRVSKKWFGLWIVLTVVRYHSGEESSRDIRACRGGAYGRDKTDTNPSPNARRLLSSRGYAVIGRCGKGDEIDGDLRTSRSTLLQYQQIRGVQAQG